MTTETAAASNCMSPCQDCARRSHCLGAALTEGPAGQNTAIVRSVIDKGAHLYRAGDTADTLYLIRSGAAKTYTVSVQGDEEIRGFQLANDIAGLDSVCGGSHRLNARALGRTWVCKLPASAVRARMSESPRFRDRLLACLDREFDRLHGMLHRERCSADQRVAAFLVAQLPADGDDVELPMSRVDLGRYLDLATETVSRVFTRLQERHVLRSEGARCRVLDRAALAATA